MSSSTEEKVESRGRGFASMDRARQRQISSQGGKAAHQKGTAHEFDSKEAREAGRKGGMVSGGRRRSRTPAPANINGGAVSEPENKPVESHSESTEASHQA
jgi:general stress protein YciG